MIFGDQGTAFAEQMRNSGFRFLHQTWARRYRTRVENATLLLHRLIGKTLRASNRLIGRVLMFDASRGFGREVLGIREDVVMFPDGCDIPTVCSRRLVTSTLSHGHMSAADKGATLLGAAFRDHGPTKKQFGDWCDSVFVILTDDGVESVVADARNCLPLFFGLTAVSTDREFLFMNALRVSGWNHVCHGITEECISSLSWYPSWISAFKDLCTILALPAYKDAFAKALVVSGQEDLLPLPSLSSFVESRFGLLVRCASDALKWKQILRSIASSVDVFFNMDTKLLRVLKFACSVGEESEVFWQRTNVVVSVFSPIDTLRRWGNGCDCHADERNTGKQFVCALAGRRLGKAYLQAQGTLNELAALRSGANATFVLDGSLHGDAICIFSKQILDCPIDLVT